MISLLLCYYLLPVGLMSAAYCDTVFTNIHAAPLLCLSLPSNCITSQTVRVTVIGNRIYYYKLLPLFLMNCMLSERSDMLTLNVSFTRLPYFAEENNADSSLLIRDLSSQLCMQLSSFPLIPTALSNTTCAECEFTSRQTCMVMNEPSNGSQKRPETD